MSTNTITQTGTALTVLRRAGGDCTNRGVSSRAERVVLVGAFDVTGTFYQPQGLGSCPAGEGEPAVAVRAVGGGWALPTWSFNLVPVLWDAEAGTYVQAPGWHMAGGNYALPGSAADVIAAVTGLTDTHAPLAIHDRIE